MNLLQLKEAVDTAIEMAGEYEANPEDVHVCLQIDLPNAYYVGDEVELHYDDNGMASGCVLQSYAEKAGE